MTNYFIDHDAYTAALTGTLTFTNGSTTVTGSGTAFTTELAVGDYIKSDDATEGKEWYKVTAITSDTELTIDHAFYQATHSATAKKNSNDGLSAANAFCHIQQFFDVAVAGDVGYVRRGKTYYLTQIASPVNDGTYSSYIILKADDGTGWVGEETLDPPIISADGKDLSYSYVFDVIGDYCWQFEDFTFDDMTFSIDPYAQGAMFGRTGYCKIKNCSFGLNVINPRLVSAKGRLEIENCSGFNIHLYQDSYSKIYVNECANIGRIDGYSMAWVVNDIIIKNSSFSSTTPIIHGRIKMLSSGMIDNGAMTYMHESAYVEDGTSHAAIFYSGRLDKDNTIYTGSASSSVKATPSSNCNLDNPLMSFEWKITDVTAAQHTVTVAVMGSGWDDVTPDFPTADELYIEVEYYDQTTGTHTATAKSTEVLTANDTWTAFTVTFTPAQDGDIYVRGYLKKYESGAVVYFNGEVEIT